MKKRHYADSIVDKGKYEQSKAKIKYKYLPSGEIETFLSGLEARVKLNPERFIYWLVALFQVRSGTRIGETCAIDFRDIDFETGEVMVSKTVQWTRKKGRPTAISPLTKTGEPRIIYLPNQVLNALKQWRLSTGRSAGLVFSFDGFQPITYRSVQHQFDMVLTEMGSEWRSTHILRHSFSTDYLEKTGDKQGLQGQLGHRSSKQTDHYAKITNTVKREGMRAYSQCIEGRGSNVFSLAPIAEARWQKKSR